MLQIKKFESFYKILALACLSTLALFLNGCSTAYNSGYSAPQSRSIPSIPEISRPVVRRSAPVVKRRVVSKPKVYRPKVKKYSVDKPAPPVITQTEVAAVLSKEEIVHQAQTRATVDIDPYASIPESGTVKSTVLNKSTPSKPAISTAKASPAVKSLMLRARAELAIGNTKSAVTSLERGLRIESQNPELWNLLAKAHYDQSNYQQAISMSKKSIRYSRNDDLIAKNWALIQKAGERSGDTTVVKEAINYFKVNP